MADYACMYSVDTTLNMTVYWRDEEDTISFAVTVFSTGWFSVGWSPPPFGFMIGSDVVIARENPMVLGAHVIRERDSSSILKHEAPFKIINPSIDRRSNSTTIRFTRRYDDGNVTILRERQNIMVWALSGDGNNPIFGYHREKRGSFTLDLTGKINDTSLNVTRNTSSSTMCSRSVLREYDCQLEVGVRCFVHWRVSGDFVSYALQVPGSRWVALGWSANRPGTMTNSEVVIASGTPWSVSTFKISGREEKFIKEQKNLFVLTKTSVTHENDSTILRFARNYGNGIIPKESSLIWAIGKNGETKLAYHSDNRGAFVLSIEGASVRQKRRAGHGYYQAHGWLMGIAYGILFPLGVFVARFGQIPSFTPEWFLMHRVVVCMGVVFAFIAAIISFSKFDALDTSHGQLGLSVLLLTWLQPLLGMMRPNQREPGRIRWFVAHWLVGNTVVVLGCANIFLGLKLYSIFSLSSLRPHTILFAIYICLLGFAYQFMSLMPYLKDHR